jgi:TRAP-type C4-dicarboxylate transport system permease small subunit
VGGINLVYITFALKQISSALQIPIGFVYLVIPLSGLFVIYYSSYEIFSIYRGNQASFTADNI